MQAKFKMSVAGSTKPEVGSGGAGVVRRRGVSGLGAGPRGRALERGATHLVMFGETHLCGSEMRKKKRLF